MCRNDPSTPASAAPVAAAKYLCPECNVPVAQTAKRRRVFCSDKHKQAHANRRAARGKALVGLALGWRINRGSGEVAKAAFQQICSMLDEWNAEDRAAGRPRADLYASLLLEQGDFVDRRNVRPTCTKGFQGCHERADLAFACASHSEWARHARPLGWIVEPGNETCPNCREDKNLGEPLPA